MVAKPNLRLAVAALMALSVSLPIAALSLTKVLLFITGLCFLVKEALVSRQMSVVPQSRVCQVILIAIAFWSASLVWTGAALEDALIAYVKHGKLLTVPILVLLLKDSREVRLSMYALAAGQCFVMVSSWLMAFNIALPWVARPSGFADPLTQFVPYADSYLDQSIMLAATAGIFWHLVRGQVQSISRSLSGLFAYGCLLNVMVLMPGRTGYLLAITAACMAAIFEVHCDTEWPPQYLHHSFLGSFSITAYPSFSKESDWRRKS